MLLFKKENQLSAFLKSRGCNKEQLFLLSALCPGRVKYLTFSCLLQNNLLSVEMLLEGFSMSNNIENPPKFSKSPVILQQTRDHVLYFLHRRRLLGIGHLKVKKKSLI